MDIINHLYTSYTVISTVNLSKNDNRTKAKFDANFPFEGLLRHIEDAVDFAKTSGAPYTPLHILNAAYHIVFQYGFFVEECRIWKCRPYPLKKWPHFKLDFTRDFQ